MGVPLYSNFYECGAKERNGQGMPHAAIECNAWTCDMPILHTLFFYSIFIDYFLFKDDVKMM